MLIIFLYHFFFKRIHNMRNYIKIKLRVILLSRQFFIGKEMGRKGSFWGLREANSTGDIPDG